MFDLDNQDIPRLGFHGKLKAERVGGRNWRQWKLISPLGFVCQTHQEITVPAGFVSDGASIPRGLWNLFPPWGRWAESAVTHDYLYSVGCVSRKRADEIFAEAMEWQCVPRWKRRVMYLAVRVGGWKAWRMHRRND